MKYFKSHSLQLIIFLTVVFPNLAISGTSSEKRCHSSYVRTFSHSEYAGTLKYQVLPKAGKRQIITEDPVLIYIQGGPGGFGIIEDSNMSLLVKNITSVMSQVRMDLRGTGCNRNVNRPISELKIETEYFVNDWLALIDHLKLKSVIILGESYGTVMATRLAHELETRNKVKVKGVLLSGTLGQTGIKGRLHLGYLQKWELTQNNFQFLQANGSKDLPQRFGFSNKDWVDIVVYALTVGYYLSEDGMQSHIMEWLPIFSDPYLSKSIKESDRKVLIDSARKLLKKDAEQKFIYNKINCEELIPEGNEYNFTWKNGKLIPSSGNQCKDYNWREAFNPEKWPIKAPITYFEGGYDPNTPIQGAMDHLRSQVHSDRTLIYVPFGGHGVHSLSLGLCFASMLNDIVKMRGVGIESLRDCRVPIEIEQFKKEKTNML